MFKVNTNEPPICPPNRSHNVSNGILGATWLETKESKQEQAEYRQYLKDYSHALDVEVSV